MNNKLVLVADGSRAKFVSAKGRKLQDVIHNMNNEDLNSHDDIKRKESRTGDGHFHDPTTSIKDLEKESFARILVGETQKHMNGNSYDSLIIVASPKMLGILRKGLNSHIEIDRSFSLEATHMDLPQLEDRIFD